MTKRGRPKNTRPSVDLGTPEQAIKRLAALGPQRQGWPAPDPTHAESALGRLLWRGYLGGAYDEARRLYEAGVTFCGWWMLTYPKTFSTGTLGRLQAGSSGECDRETAEMNLRHATVALGKRRSVLDAVINAAVYQRVQPHAVELLQAGLAQLADLQREQRRAA